MCFNSEGVLQTFLLLNLDYKGLINLKRLVIGL